MLRIRIFALCCAASWVVSCADSTAPTAPAAGISAAAVKTPTITITALGVFSPTDLNDAGQVVGYTEPAPYRAVLWHKEVLYDLGTLPGGDNAQAQGINAGGQIVGYGNAGSTGYNHAILWDHGVARDLGTLPGGLNGLAHGINPAGVIVGRSETAGGPESDGIDHAVIWNHGVITDLGTLPNLPLSDAADISASGEVVGTSGGGNAVHAFLWSKGVMTDLGVLPGGARAGAAGISPAGQIVGYSETATQLHHAVLWDKKVIQDLGTLPGGTDSHAADVNAAGHWSVPATQRTGSTTRFCGTGVI